MKKKYIEATAVLVELNGLEIIRTSIPTGPDPYGEDDFELI